VVKLKVVTAAELAIDMENIMQRFGQIIGVKPDQIDTYERLHAAVWPEVLDMIHQCNIRNYTIFRHGSTLFAYFEYVGEDYEADMAKMAADPKTQEWWTTMAEVFHSD
jgi:L-rhamnose mutarotase